MFFSQVKVCYARSWVTSEFLPSLKKLRVFLHLTDPPANASCSVGSITFGAARASSTPSSKTIPLQCPGTSHAERIRARGPPGGPQRFRLSVPGLPDLNCSHIDEHWGSEDSEKNTEEICGLLQENILRLMLSFADGHYGSLDSYISTVTRSRLLQEDTVRSYWAFQRNTVWTLEKNTEEICGLLLIKFRRIYRKTWTISGLIQDKSTKILLRKTEDLRTF